MFHSSTRLRHNQKSTKHPTSIEITYLLKSVVQRPNGPNLWHNSQSINLGSDLEHVRGFQSSDVKSRFWRAFISALSCACRRELSTNRNTMGEFFHCWHICEPLLRANWYTHKWRWEGEITISLVYGKSQQANATSLLVSSKFNSINDTPLRRPWEPGDKKHLPMLIRW